MCILEPGIPFEDILFEITSAFGTVGLSTGITPGLSSLSKLLEVLVMYIGRLGPLTIVTIGYSNPLNPYPMRKEAFPSDRGR